MHRKQVSELERIVGLEAECSKLRNSLQAERSSLRKVVDEKVFVHASITACMRMEMEMCVLSVCVHILIKLSIFVECIRIHRCSCAFSCVCLPVRAHVGLKGCFGAQTQASQHARQRSRDCTHVREKSFPSCGGRATKPYRRGPRGGACVCLQRLGFAFAVFATPSAT